MHATPGASFAPLAVADLDFQFRWVLVEIVAVVRYSKTARGRVDCERISKAEFAKLVMMPVGLAVGCDIDQTCLPAGRCCATHKALDQRRTRGQCLFKGNRLGELRIVEEHGQGTPRTVAMKIVVGDAGID